jgi:hypothetical protein
MVAGKLSPVLLSRNCDRDNPTLPTFVLTLRAAVNLSRSTFSPTIRPVLPMPPLPASSTRLSQAVLRRATLASQRARPEP